MEINTCDYSAISNKITKLNFICFCVYVHVDCNNYLFFVFNCLHDVYNFSLDIKASFFFFFYVIHIISISY